VLSGDRGAVAQLVAGIVVYEDRLVVRLKSENADEPSDSPGRARPAHPSPKINGYVPRCDSSCTIAVRDGGVAHRHNNVVKAFPSDRTDQPFSICVLPWGTRRCRPVANGHGSKSADEDLAIGPVPITNEIAGDIAWRVVMSWFTDRPADSRTLADEIPFLPRREDDYTLRAAVVRTDPCNDSP
jgi:hypothetical protein